MTAIVWPGVKVGTVGLPLSPSVSPNLVRAVVDTHLHLPDMFELTFYDESGSVVSDAGLDIGTAVEVTAGRADGDSAESLIKGEVTAIEAVCHDGLIYSVVRGYEKAHRLQRARRTRTFLRMRDSEIAEQVAKGAGLAVGTVDRTVVEHEHLAQVAQTDWDFLTQRAREIGYETGVAGGKFFFRKPSTGDFLPGPACKLTYKDNLLTFLPRVSSANLTPDVEVRVWDSKAARVAVASATATTHSATIEEDPADLANSFTDGLLPVPTLPALPSIPGLPKLDLGLPASNTAYLVVDRPVARGAAADSAAAEVAKGVADHMASTFAEAEGDASGDPAIQAGAEVEIGGVPERFTGKWVVTNARHVFDAEENGYHTRFWVSGRQNRSLLGLTTTHSKPAGITGLVCGVVTNVKDPEKKGRVKVALPWLADNYESDWARTAHPGAGRRTGTFLLPEVGDEVLVGFEFGDPRRPYVLGGLLNDNTAFGHVDTAVNGAGSVTRRGFATPAGNRLLFTDDLPPGAAPPTTSSIALGTADDKLALTIDQVAGTVTLACDPVPPASRTPAGSLTIQCGGTGTVTVKAGTGGLRLETEGRLELSGKLGVAVSSPGVTEIKGSQVRLN
ncbi:phage baseplate assembly protein V [Actinokineospora enzanensis]|uniref:phage baseplate assembly protein V n=1 Tax=Actinokineospora enzanensis TaxID=155975 RepID=UPI00037147EA|nr:phage baseplate assembly protein V [Actinokineospora enzanensis]